MPNDDNREQLREKYYQEGKEKGIKSEQKRLNDIFSILGDINDDNASLYFFNLDYETHKIKNGIESGDREAMLVLIAIVADSLLAFEVLPNEIKKTLAYGLKKIMINLYEAKGFLPAGRGETSKKEEREQSNKAYWTALTVEHHRFYDGYKLDEAIEKVSEEKGLTESLVKKRWKKKHKDAKMTLEMISSITKRPKKELVSKPRRKR